MSDPRHGQVRSSVVGYKFLSGDIQTAAVFQRDNVWQGSSDGFIDSSVEEVFALFLEKKISGTRLLHYLENSFGSSFTTSLRGLSVALRVYSSLPTATVELSVIPKPLYQRRWISNSRNSNFDTRANAFSCIAVFEISSVDINPEDAVNVIAISVGNSIYVLEGFLRDPCETPPRDAMRRIIGNIGKPGLALLVSPKDPKSREVEYNTWNVVNHTMFDGKLEDSFRGTSLHLSFTGFDLPLLLGDTGRFDTEAYLLESVIQCTTKAFGSQTLIFLQQSKHYQTGHI